MTPRSPWMRPLAFVASLALGAPLAAQTPAPAAPPRPWGRVSFFTNASHQTADGDAGSNRGEMTTSFAYQLPEHDGEGLEYGVDVRHSGYTGSSRPRRLALYEAFAGGRVADGRVRFRAGQLWLNDLGSLGSLAGGTVEWRQPRPTPTAGRVRLGVFGGLEPSVLDVGVVPNVRKFGGYVTYEGEAARRHTLGYVRVSNRSLIERSVLTTTNYWTAARRVFVYQAMEYDLQAPAGQAGRGLTYFFTTARARVTDRFELQGQYNRGHSIDVRGLSENILAGRPVSQAAAEGLLYSSVGGRATIRVLPSVRLYGGYASDRNSRDAEASGRVTVGGYASNVADSGWDLSGSDTLMVRPTGRYHSRFVSVGRQVGRSVYASLDYHTSLSIVRYSRSDGVVVETRPHTTRWSGTTSIHLPGSASLLVTLERTRDDDYSEVRVMAGITYRIRR